MTALKMLPVLMLLSGFLISCQQNNITIFKLCPFLCYQFISEHFGENQDSTTNGCKMMVHSTLIKYVHMPCQSRPVGPSYTDQTTKCPEIAILILEEISASECYNVLICSYISDHTLKNLGYRPLEIVSL